MKPRAEYNHNRHVSAHFNHGTFEQTPHLGVASRSDNEGLTFGLGARNQFIANGWSKEAENVKQHRRINSSVNQSEASIEAIVTTKNERREKNRQKARQEGSASPGKKYSLMQVVQHTRDNRRRSPMRKEFEEPDLI